MLEEYGYLCRAFKPIEAAPDVLGACPKVLFGEVGFNSRMKEDVEGASEQH